MSMTSPATLPSFGVKYCQQQMYSNLMTSIQRLKNSRPDATNSITFIRTKSVFKDLANFAGLFKVCATLVTSGRPLTEPRFWFKESGSTNWFYWAFLWFFRCWSYNLAQKTSRAITCGTTPIAFRKESIVRSWMSWPATRMRPSLGS